MPCLTRATRRRAAPRRICEGTCATSLRAQFARSRLRLLDRRRPPGLGHVAVVPQHFGIAQRDHN
eukprot:15442169-Alexandrium_andersonii.AAC.1